MSDFKIDWEANKVLCPQSQLSHQSKQTHDTRGRSIMQVDFHQRHCKPCPSRSLYTKAKNEPREITLRPKEQHLAIEQRRPIEQQTDEWQQKYHQLAGIEGTISQGVRGFGMRTTRYKGLAKTHLQNLAIAAAINIERAVNFLLGVPSEKTRISRFAMLALAA